MEKKLHIFAVSDSVGETAEKIAVASVLQFQVERSITRFSRVTKEIQIDEIIEKASEEDALVIYTIVKQELSSYMDSAARAKGVPALNLMTPLFDMIEAKTGLKPVYISGLTHTLDDQYFNRMKAIEFTIEHDNGQNLDTFKDADLIILGLPRTSKTPLSMHMANLGIKVANYPILIDTEIPKEIEALKGMVSMVGLTIDTETLLSLRRERMQTLGTPEEKYSDNLDDLVAEELDNAYRIYARLKCLVIDVTLHDIEEVGNTITHKFNLPLRVTHHRF
ncbi:MAG: kinase/pyrophosphorylase [Syntrophomonadaceae bacterium]|jgi:regulator of PEP synthase PpsR (kinase-PPPase family)|nr:kinase/pyrophosphorylase [Syntrophomonadaceae bacterium]